MNAAVDVLQSTHQHINRDRLWQSLMELAKLGATVKGGVCRLALTDLDRQAGIFSSIGAKRPVAPSASMPSAISLPAAPAVTRTCHQ